MPISNKPWGSISESDYQDAAAFCKAARKLLRLYSELDEEPPESLRRLAGG